MMVEAIFKLSFPPSENCWVGVPRIKLSMGENATHLKATPLNLEEGGVWVRVSPLTSSARALLVGMSLNQVIFPSVKWRIGLWFEGSSKSFSFLPEGQKEEKQL